MPNVYLLLFLSSCLAIAGQILFKIGSGLGDWVRVIFSPQLIGGMVCYFISMVLWIYSLQKVPLGVAYAFTTLTFVGVYAASFVILKEPPTIPKLIGLFLIVSGFVVLVKWA